MPIDITMQFDAEEVVAAYELRLRTYKLFESILCKYIEGIVERIKQQGSVGKVSVESRTKDPNSFKGKITRDNKKAKYQEPLKEVTDLVGIKVMLTSLKDKGIVYAILEEELKDEIDRANSVNKSQHLKQERRFGYLGRHLVVYYSPKMLDYGRKNGIELGDIDEKDLVGLRAEIQVKTLLQHVWAEIEHKVRYKAGEELCIDKKRYFDRIAALIEIADDTFRDLIYESERVEKKTNEVIEVSVSDDGKHESTKQEDIIMLGSDIVAFYLANEKVKQKFKNLQAGRLQIAYNEEPDSISADFLHMLEYANIERLDELNMLLDNKEALAILHKYVEHEYQSKGYKTILQKLSVIQVLAYVYANREGRENIKRQKLIYEGVSNTIDQILS